MFPQYFTIIIRANTEAESRACRKLIPGELIGPAVITGCSLGDALAMNDRLKDLIPERHEEAVQKLEQADLANHFPPS